MIKVIEIKGLGPQLQFGFRDDATKFSFQPHIEYLSSLDLVHSDSLALTMV